MGGFDRKPGGGTLVQQQGSPTGDHAVGKQTLTAQLDGGSARPASAGSPAARLPDADIAVLLSQQDEADAIEAARLASVVNAEADTVDPSLGPPDGVPLARQDHATHWGSPQQRVDWVRENFSRARFSSTVEKWYYEDVLARGATQLQDQDDGVISAVGAQRAPTATRYVWTISFVSPGVLGPMIRERDGWMLQTAPDPSAGTRCTSPVWWHGCACVPDARAPSGGTAVHAAS